jgi:hypothetical protein
MADPVTIGAAVISGLVTLLSTHAKYRADFEQAQQKDSVVPEKPEEAKRGEAALAIVKAGIEQRGTEKEQADLKLFERNPQRYQDGLVRALTNLAMREPTFAQQLQRLVQQANIQTSGVQGNVNVSGQGKIYGSAAGLNAGTISGTYTFGGDDETDKHK